jgi:hypothetical protein
MLKNDTHMAKLASANWEKTTFHFRLVVFRRLISDFLQKQLLLNARTRTYRKIRLH